MSGNRGSRFVAGWLLKKITKVKKKYERENHNYDLTGKQGTVKSLTKQMKMLLWNVKTIYNPRKVLTWLQGGRENVGRLRTTCNW